jgi:hypothetical protein
MIKLNGHKITANQLAKIAVIDKGSCWDYFMESYDDVWEAMTEKERTDYNEAGTRQMDRIYNLLDPGGKLHDLAYGDDPGEILIAGPPVIDFDTGSSDRRGVLR